MEYWDIYDVNGNKTNKIRKKGDKLEQGEYHLAMEAWIVNSNGNILIQKRSEKCEILPGVWGLTTGRMISGENTIEGCIREVKEEIGLNISKEDLNFVRRIFRTDLIWDIYLIKKDVEINQLNLQENEVSEVKWVSIDEFNKMLDEGSLFKYPEIQEVILHIQK